MKGLGKLHRVNQSSIEYMLKLHHKGIYSGLQLKENIPNPTTNIIIPTKKLHSKGITEAKSLIRSEIRGRQKSA